MKKAILIFTAIVISGGLLAWNHLNKESEGDSTKSSKHTSEGLNTSFANQLGILEEGRNGYFYNLGSRFRPVKKSFLASAIGIKDFLTNEEYERIDSVKSVKFVLYENEQNSTKTDEHFNEEFSEEQKEFLVGLTHSTNFILWAEYKERNQYDESILMDSYTTPHLTVVPEKQVEYKAGMGPFYQYLRRHTQNEMDLTDLDELAPAKLYLLIDKEGKLSDMRLMRSSNDKRLDEKIMKVLNELPSDWNPAENEKGEKVEQELVLSYGAKGC